jgi:hypothetical protein
MQSGALTSPIPYRTAARLCAEIRQEAETNWHTQAARWCWECQQTTGGDPTRRGFLRSSGNRGCILVNSRYAGLQRLG